MSGAALAGVRTFAPLLKRVYPLLLLEIAPAPVPKSDTPP